MEEHISTKVLTYTPEPQHAHEWGNVPLAGFTIIVLFALFLLYVAERYYARRKDRNIERIHDKLDEIKTAIPNKETVEKIRQCQIEYELKNIELQDRQTAILERVEETLSGIRELSAAIRIDQAENYKRMWDFVQPVTRNDN